MEKKIYSSFQKALATDCLFICGQRDGLAVGEGGEETKGKKGGGRAKRKVGRTKMSGVCLVLGA